MILPAVTLLTVFRYVPMYGTIAAFQRYKPWLGYRGSPWVGLDNYIRIFSRSDIWEIIRNTFVISMGKIAIGEAASLVFALLLNEVSVVWFKRVIQTLSYLLYFLSWVLFGGILVNILGFRGLLNSALGAFGLKPVLWLADPNLFQPVIVLTHTWKEYGWGAVVIIAALAGIDPTLYEVAAVDGANRWQRVLHITLPGVAPMVVMLLCLSLGNVLNAGFEQLLVMQNSAVLSTGDILETYVYREGLQLQQYSLATAVGLFRSIVGLVMVSLSWWLAGKLANYRIL